MTSSEKTLPLSFFVKLIGVLALLGIIDSAYLAIAHYKNYTDIFYSSFCAISRSINCDTVAQSAYSILWGVPLAVWGIVDYLFVLLLVFEIRRCEQAERRKNIISILLFFSIINALGSLFLAYISHTKIHSYCLLCILSYALNFGLLFFSWLLYHRFCQKLFFDNLANGILFLIKQKSFKLGCLLLLSISIILIVFFPAYWFFPNGIDLEGRQVPHGKTEYGNYWIGAKNPELIIEVFSDYMCFQCFKTHFFLQQLVVNNPEFLRVVYYHFPMDDKFNQLLVKEPYHVGAGKMALLAIYAETIGKFPEMSELLFRIARNRNTLNTKKISEELQVPHRDVIAALSNPSFRLILRNDIRRGGMNCITGTPSFIINGKVYNGFLPKEILSKYLSF